MSAQGCGFLIEAVSTADVVDPAVAWAADFVALELAVGEIEVVVFAADLGGPEGAVGIFDDGDGAREDGEGLDAGAGEVVYGGEFYKLR